ncbi:unnamed protein product, partial [Prunus brigantina]
WDGVLSWAAWAVPFIVAFGEVVLLRAEAFCPRGVIQRLLQEESNGRRGIYICGQVRTVSTFASFESLWNEACVSCVDRGSMNFAMLDEAWHRLGDRPVVGIGAESPSVVEVTSSSEGREVGVGVE